MRVFISWSGEASKQVAELLKWWLPQIIQEAEVFVSSRDIEKGQRWTSVLSEALSEIDYGLIVLTKSNTLSPWVMFEAGALSKSIKARVIPVLCGVDRIELAGNPVSQFQNVPVTPEEMREMIVALNGAADRPLDEVRLEAAFDKWWPDFEGRYKEVVLPKQVKQEPKKLSEDKRLSNIETALESVLAKVQKIAREVAQPPLLPAIEPPFNTGEYKISDYAKPRNAGKSFSDYLAGALDREASDGDDDEKP